MEKISIHVSPKQLSKLRNGHRVRVKQPMSGSGIVLMVDPSKYNAITRSFNRGSAAQVQLDPAELQANKEAAMSGEVEGMGIYAGGKLSLKQVGKAFKQAGRTIKKALTSKPAKRIIKKIGSEAASTIVQAGARTLGVDPASAKLAGRLAAMGAEEGISAAYGSGMCGSGIYAGVHGGALLGPRSRVPEVSSVSIGGTLLGKQAHLNPALQSDPMGANFHMNTQLPAAYQRGGIRFV